MQRQAPLDGVFDDSTKSDRAIEQLRHLGISDRHIQRHEKSAGWDITHAIRKRKETPEEMKPDFTGMGVSTAETERYEDAYEAGYVLVVVHPGNSREQALHILQDNAAYNYAQQPGQENAPPEEMGAVTPGMRGEDSSQTGIAT